jgi:hypothetical protein
MLGLGESGRCVPALLTESARWTARFEPVATEGTQDSCRGGQKVWDPRCDRKVWDLRYE